MSVEQSDKVRHILRGFNPSNLSRIIIALRSQEHSAFSTLEDVGPPLILGPLDRADALRLAWQENLLLRPRLTDQGYDHSVSTEEALELNDLAQEAALPYSLSHQQVASLDEISRLGYFHPVITKIAIKMVHNFGWNSARQRFQSLRGKGIDEALNDCVGQLLQTLELQEPGCLNTLRTMLIFSGGADIRCLQHVMSDQQKSDLVEFEDEYVYPLVKACLLTWDKEAQHYHLDTWVRTYIEQKHPLDILVYTERLYLHAEAYLEVVKTYATAVMEQRMTYAAPIEWSNVATALDRLAEMSTNNDRAAQLLVNYIRYCRRVLVSGYDPRRMYWLNSAVIAAERIGHNQDQASILLNVGDIYRSFHMMDESLECYERALVLFEMLDDQNNIALAKQCIGDAQYNRGELELALTNYEKALSIYQSLDSKSGQVRTLLDIARIEHVYEQFSSARSRCDTALKILQENGNKLDEAHALHMLAIVQRSCHDPESALYNHKMALKIFQEMEDRHCESHALICMSELLAYKNTEMAQEYLHKAYLIQISMHNCNAKTMSCVNIFAKIGRRPSAASEFFLKLFMWQSSHPSTQRLLFLHRKLYDLALEGDRKAINEMLDMFENSPDQISVSRMPENVKYIFSHLSEARKILGEAFCTRVAYKVLRFWHITQEEEISRTITRLEPLWLAVVDAARGNIEQRSMVENTLNEMEMIDYSMKEAVHSLWEGQRDVVMLTQRLNDYEKAYIYHILHLLRSSD